MTDEKITIEITIAKLDKMPMIEKVHKVEIPQDKSTQKEPMTCKEAINYLIPPVSTSTEPSAEYLKQKEAYDLAVKVLGYFVDKTQLCTNTSATNTELNVANSAK